VGVFILLIVHHYTNLATARAMQRAKESECARFWIKQNRSCSSSSCRVSIFTAIHGRRAILVYFLLAFGQIGVLM